MEQNKSMWIDSEIARECSNQFFCKVWRPKEIVIVLGSSNKPEDEVFLDAARETTVLKRSGGGGAVVLHPGCLIVGVGAWVENYFGNKKYFELLNSSLISTLAKLGNFGAVKQCGISDLASSNKKFCGTSLFRSKNYLLFQASILIDRKIELISKLLKHPTKEPGYREKRSHEDFLTDLATLDPGCEYIGFEYRFYDILNENLKVLLANEFSHVDPVHADYLQNRF